MSEGQKCRWCENLQSRHPPKPPPDQAAKGQEGLHSGTIQAPNGTLRNAGVPLTSLEEHQAPHTKHTHTVRLKWRSEDHGSLLATSSILSGEKAE